MAKFLNKNALENPAPQGSYLLELFLGPKALIFESGIPYFLFLLIFRSLIFLLIIFDFSKEIKGRKNFQKSGRWALEKMK